MSKLVLTMRQLGVLTREQTIRETRATELEQIASHHRARGEFDAAVRFDDYASSMRYHGHTRGVTANGTGGRWI